MVIIFHRYTKVYLHCDQSRTTPFATTEGDSSMLLNYVSYRNALASLSLSLSLSLFLSLSLSKLNDFSSTPAGIRCVFMCCLPRRVQHRQRRYERRRTWRKRWRRNRVLVIITWMY